MSFELRTERLVLVPLREDLAEGLLAYVIRNKDYLEQWETKRHSVYYTLDVQRQLLASDLLAIDSGQLFKVAIFKADRPETPIGTISLSNIVRGSFLSCHLGYRLDREEAGQGYMTEALVAVIRHAFGTLELHRVEANIMPRNEASRRVVEKLGFVHEGLAVKYLKINGVWEDHVYWVLLNDELE